jgi:hypothetical protein
MARMFVVQRGWRRLWSGSGPDPYRVLKLGRGATQAEIRSRYLELARILHPDARGGLDSSAFAEIANAYQQLNEMAANGPSSALQKGYPFDDEGDLTSLMKLRRCVTDETLFPSSLLSACARQLVEVCAYKTDAFSARPLTKRRCGFFAWNRDFVGRPNGRPRKCPTRW